MTTVTSFESVGAILVVALLIAPPATAYLLTENFTKMLLLTCIQGVIISILGYYIAKLCRRLDSRRNERGSWIIIWCGVPFQPDPRFSLYKEAIRLGDFNILINAADLDRFGFSFKDQSPIKSALHPFNFPTFWRILSEAKNLFSYLLQGSWMREAVLMASPW